MWFRKKKEISKEISSGITFKEWLEKYSDKYMHNTIKIYVGCAGVYERVTTEYGIYSLSYGDIMKYRNNIVKNTLTILNSEKKVDHVAIFIIEE